MRVCSPELKVVEDKAGSLWLRNCEDVDATWIEGLLTLSGLASVSNDGRGIVVLS